MSEQITVRVSDRVVRSATHVAVQSQRRIEDVLADWLDRMIFMRLPSSRWRLLVL